MRFLGSQSSLSLQRCPHIPSTSFSSISKRATVIYILMRSETTVAASYETPSKPSPLSCFPFLSTLLLTSIMGGQGLYHPARAPSNLIIGTTQHVHEQIQDPWVFENPSEGLNAGVGAEHMDSVKQRSRRSGAHTLLQLPKGPLNQRLHIGFHLPQDRFVQSPSLP